MKKLLFAFSITTIFFVSCASTPKKPELPGKEEIVEYKNCRYNIENKTYLTDKELRDDCDYLKYYLYNAYAGIDESIDNGFDLDGIIEQIYNQSLANKQKTNGLISSNDFIKTASDILAKNWINDDQHLILGNFSHNGLTLYHSNIYFEKKGDKYKVIKSDVDSIKTGDEYTGPESNLYKYYNKNDNLYRFSLMTNKKIKSGVISINNQPITIPVKTDKVIPTNTNGIGLKTTDKTLYMSLGDCSMVYGNSVEAEKFSKVFDKFYTNISKNMKGKENIIFDLRSNPGGYYDYPTKMLTAAYYNNQTDTEFQKQILYLFFNKVRTNCIDLFSPVFAQWFYDYSEDSKAFEGLNEDTKNFIIYSCKTYKTKPIRKQIASNYYVSDYTEFPQPDFKGNIYVLINNMSCSSAEFATEMSYFLQDKGINVTLVGENTWGGMKYVGMYNIQLPHSGMYLFIGSTYGESDFLKNLPAWHGEGKGMYPDYWATNDVILDTLINLTNDQQLKETLKGLDKQQLQ